MGTNGAFITDAGISLDGATAATHDAFRGVAGSFDRSVQALENRIDAGIRCSVRFMVTKRNHSELGRLIAFSRAHRVHRFCVYWLVPSGRAGDVHTDLQVGHREVQEILDQVYRETLRTDPGVMEFLTVDAPRDGACLLERLEVDAVPKNRW